MKHIKLFERNETELNFSGDELYELPELPESLKSLECFNNQLTKLPELPNSLEILACHNNKLTSLPTLPNTLKGLYCFNNKLTSLPELPDTLKELICGENPFELPLSKDIIDKFGLNNKTVYTEERLKVFEIEEWQRYFLNNYPERHKDIDWVVLNEIKHEFDYLYTSEELGLL